MRKYKTIQVPSEVARALGYKLDVSPAIARHAIKFPAYGRKHFPYVPIYVWQEIRRFCRSCK